MPDIKVSLPQPCGMDWTTMPPRGCNRFCDLCSTTVVNLEDCTIGEVEVMLQSPAKVCVRAKLNANGEIKLRKASAGKRLIATVGAGLGLVSGIPAGLAKSGEPEGVIVGTVGTSDWRVRVIATSADGRTYTAKVRSNGKFKIKHVQPGAYKLTFSGACAGEWDGGEVVVQDGMTATSVPSQNYDCIIVGMIEPRGTNG